MIKQTALILGLIALLLGVSATNCPGSLSVNDLDDLYPDHTYPILITTTISPVNGYRTLDAYIKDPEGNRITFDEELGVWMDNGTYAVQFDFEVTKYMLKGEYTFQVYLRAWNNSDVSVLMCEESTSESFYIHTNRTEYDDVVVLSIRPDFKNEVEDFDVCYNITIINEYYNDSIQYPVCVKGENVPINLDIGIKQILIENISAYNLLNSTLQVNPGVPYYSYSVMASIQQALRNHSLVIANLSVNYNHQDNSSIQMGKDIREIKTTLQQNHQTEMNYLSTLMNGTSKVSSSEIDYAEISLKNPLLTLLIGAGGVLVIALWLQKKREERNKE